jgi:PAS domain S-box-containing protein
MFVTRCYGLCQPLVTEGRLGYNTAHECLFAARSGEENALMLDVRTLLTLYALSSAVYAALLLILWRQHRLRYSGLAHWGIALILQTLGLVLSTFRDIAPQLASVVLGSTLVLAGIFVLRLGMARFAERRSTPVPGIVFLALFAAAMTYFTAVRPAIYIRTLLITAGLAFLTGRLGVFLLFQVDRPLRRVARFTGILLGVYCASSLVRILLIFLYPSTITEDYFRTPAFQTVSLLLFEGLNLALTFSLVLMVTGRLRADDLAHGEERRKTELALRESEIRQSAVFHASPVGIGLTHFPEGRVRDANQMLLRLLDREREEVIGRPITEMNVWQDPAERERVIGALEASGSVRDFETRLRRKSGGIIDVLMSMELLEIQGERYILTLATDITDRKAAEHEREKLIGELQAALAQVKALRGLMPICASCKKIRDDEGYWHQVEVYLRAHSDVEFSHGLCPDCVSKLFPEIAEEVNAEVEQDSGAGERERPAT